MHQNLTFAVQPGPISGMQCWHQRLLVTPPQPGDEYGDVVAAVKSREAYLDWRSKTRPPRGSCVAPCGTPAPLKPEPSAYRLPDRG